MFHVEQSAVYLCERFFYVPLLSTSENERFFCNQKVKKTLLALKQKTVAS